MSASRRFILMAQEIHSVTAHKVSGPDVSIHANPDICVESPHNAAHQMGDSDPASDRRKHEECGAGSGTRLSDGVKLP